jgi:hypothetical protein
MLAQVSLACASFFTKNQIGQFYLRLVFKC